MSKNLIISAILLFVLLLFILVMIPIGITNSNINKLKQEVNSELIKIQHEIDSISNIKNDTLFINPIKIEIYGFEKH